MKYFILVLFLCASGVAVAQSSITWNMGMNLATNAYGNQHPRMSLDGSGNPLVVWGKSADQSVYFSRWTGTMFSTPVKLNPPWLTVATASWMGPDIASKGDTVYVVVKRTPEVADTNRVFIFTSFNGGISFNAPVELASIADSLSRFPTVTTDASGQPVVAYMKFNSLFLDSRWVVTKSTDFGNTFSDDVKASGWGGSPDVCDCCPGAITTSGNYAAMLYRNNNANIRDIWAGMSDDYATTFPGGLNVDNHNWMIMSCPSSGPDGVIIGDTLYSVFMNAGTGFYRTYLSKTLPGTGSLVTVNNLTGVVTGLSQQNYPRIASDGNAMAIVWKQTVSSVAQLPLLFTNDYTVGFPASYDTVDLADITNADVAVSNGNLYVVWQDDNSGTVKFRSGTYPVATTGINASAESNFSITPNPVTNFINLPTGKDWDTAEIKILDARGATSMHLQNSSHTTLDVSGLANGIYLVRVVTSHSIMTQKFVKQ